jgi:hypothetical protein
MMVPSAKDHRRASAIKRFKMRPSAQAAQDRRKIGKGDREVTVEVLNLFAIKRRFDSFWREVSALVRFNSGIDFDTTFATTLGVTTPLLQVLPRLTSWDRGSSRRDWKLHAYHKSSLNCHWHWIQWHFILPRWIFLISTVTWGAMILIAFFFAVVLSSTGLFLFIISSSTSSSASSSTSISIVHINPHHTKYVENNFMLRNRRNYFNRGSTAVLTLTSNDIGVNIDASNVGGTVTAWQDTVTAWQDSTELVTTFVTTLFNLRLRKNQIAQFQRLFQSSLVHNESLNDRFPFRLLPGVTAVLLQHAKRMEKWNSSDKKMEIRPHSSTKRRNDCSHTICSRIESPDSSPPGEECGEERCGYGASSMTSTSVIQVARQSAWRASHHHHNHDPLLSLHAKGRRVQKHWAQSIILLDFSINTLVVNSKSIRFY